MVRKTSKSKKPKSRNNNGFAGSFISANEEVKSMGFGVSRFRTQVNIKPSSQYQRDNSLNLNRTMGSQPQKKKRSSEYRAHKASLESSLTRPIGTKSHSVPKKPKSGRNISRNHPNAAMYSMNPKAAVTYKKRTKTSKREF